MLFFLINIAWWQSFRFILCLLARYELFYRRRWVRLEFRRDCCWLDFKWILVFYQISRFLILNVFESSLLYYSICKWLTLNFLKWLIIINAECDGFIPSKAINWVRCGKLQWIFILNGILQVLFKFPVSLLSWLRLYLPKLIFLVSRHKPLLLVISVGL